MQINDKLTARYDKDLTAQITGISADTDMISVVYSDNSEDTFRFNQISLYFTDSFETKETN